MCVVVFCFFFFKQKTAYEMRISDWSSDVCSSDLMYSMSLSKPSMQPARNPAPRETPPPGVWRWRSLSQVSAAASATVDVEIEVQIGRASWRERVCQYV